MNMETDDTEPEEEQEETALDHDASPLLPESDQEEEVVRDIVVPQHRSQGIAATTTTAITTNVPKSVLRLVHNRVTPFISNGNEKGRRCCCYGYCCCCWLSGCERPLEECSSSLFHPIQVEKVDSDESDVTT
jgi:hypothetical protein